MNKNLQTKRLVYFAAEAPLPGGINEGVAETFAKRDINKLRLDSKDSPIYKLLNELVENGEKIDVTQEISKIRKEAIAKAVKDGITAVREMGQGSSSAEVRSVLEKTVNASIEKSLRSTWTALLEKQAQLITAGYQAPKAAESLSKTVSSQVDELVEAAAKANKWTPEQAAILRARAVAKLAAETTPPSPLIVKIVVNGTRDAYLAEIVAARAPAPIVETSKAAPVSQVAEAAKPATTAAEAATEATARVAKIEATYGSKIEKYVAEVLDAMKLSSDEAKVFRSKIVSRLEQIMATGEKQGYQGHINLEKIMQEARTAYEPELKAARAAVETATEATARVARIETKFGSRIDTYVAEVLDAMKLSSDEAKVFRSKIVSRLEQIMATGEKQGYQGHINLEKIMQEARTAYEPELKAARAAAEAATEATARAARIETTFGSRIDAYIAQVLEAMKLSPEEAKVFRSNIISKLEPIMAKGEKQAFTGYINLEKIMQEARTAFEPALEAARAAARPITGADLAKFEAEVNAAGEGRKAAEAGSKIEIFETRLARFKKRIDDFIALVRATTESKINKSNLSATEKAERIAKLAEDSTTLRKTILAYVKTSGVLTFEGLQEKMATASKKVGETFVSLRGLRGADKVASEILKLDSEISEFVTKIAERDGYSHSQASEFRSKLTERLQEMARRNKLPTGEKLTVVMEEATQKFMGEALEKGAVEAKLAEGALELTEKEAAALEKPIESLVSKEGKLMRYLRIGGKAIQVVGGGLVILQTVHLVSDIDNLIRKGVWREAKPEDLTLLAGSTVLQTGMQIPEWMKGAQGMRSFRPYWSAGEAASKAAEGAVRTVEVGGKAVELGTRVVTAAEAASKGLRVLTIATSVGGKVLRVVMLAGKLCPFVDAALGVYEAGKQWHELTTELDRGVADEKRLADEARARGDIYIPATTRGEVIMKDLTHADRTSASIARGSARLTLSEYNESTSEEDKMVKARNAARALEISVRSFGETIQREAAPSDKPWYSRAWSSVIDATGAVAEVVATPFTYGLADSPEVAERRRQRTDVESKISVVETIISDLEKIPLESASLKATIDALKQAVRTARAALEKGTKLDQSQLDQLAGVDQSLLSARLEQMRPKLRENVNQVIKFIQDNISKTREDPNLPKLQSLEAEIPNINSEAGLKKWIADFQVIQKQYQVDLKVARETADKPVKPIPGVVRHEINFRIRNSQQHGTIPYQGEKYIFEFDQKSKTFTVRRDSDGRTESHKFIPA